MEESYAGRTRLQVPATVTSQKHRGGTLGLTWAEGVGRSRAAQMLQVLCIVRQLTASLPSAPMNTQRPECAAMGLAARGMIAPNLSE